MTKSNEIETIAMTEDQARYLRNSLHFLIENHEKQADSYRNKPDCKPEILEVFDDATRRSKEIANILFDAPSYKRAVDLPLDQPHVHYKL